MLWALRWLEEHEADLKESGSRFAFLLHARQYILLLQPQLRITNFDNEFEAKCHEKYCAIPGKLRQSLALAFARQHLAKFSKSFTSGMCGS